MKALVTGANGLIGANLVRELLVQGVEVRALVRNGADLAALEGLDLELRKAELSGPQEALREAAAGCGLVFHTAMHFSYERSRRDDQQAAATLGTERLLHAAADAGVRRVVITSSSVVFGYGESRQVIDEVEPRAQTRGENDYVAAKIRQDALAMALGKRLGLDLVAVCPTLSVGPFGSRLGPSNGLIVAYLSDPFRASFAGGCNLVSTADVARGHWLAARHGASDSHYILGSENLEWPAVHRLIAELAGVEPPRVQLSAGSSYLAAGIEELRASLGGRPALGNRQQASMVGRYYWYSHAKAAGLGYRPRSARRALAEAISWLATSRHVSRELRASLRLHDDVYAVRWPLEHPQEPGHSSRAKYGIHQ